jgi:hypothetical protein
MVEGDPDHSFFLWLKRLCKNEINLIIPVRHPLVSEQGPAERSIPVDKGLDPHLHGDPIMDSSRVFGTGMMHHVSF